MKRKSPTQERKFIEARIEKFHGNMNLMEKAIGMYYMGHQFGWRVLLLVHDKKTIRNYEKLLDIDIREEFPERGPLSHRSIGLKMADKVGNFWKVVRGGVKGGRTPEITD
jgi:hypothetical protein